MKIGFVTSGYPPDLGGIEVVVHGLAQHLADKGHIVEVLTHAGPQSQAGAYEQDGVLVRRFAVPHGTDGLRFSSWLVGELLRRRGDFDVVHAHNYHALPALGAALSGMRPLVFTPHFHGGGHDSLSRFAHIAYRPLGAHLLRACAHVVCVSQAEATALRKTAPRLRAPLSVIPNGVDVAALAGAAPFTVKHRVALAAGRMHSYKQFDLIARAAEYLADDTRIVLLGDGPDRGLIESIVRQHRLENRVHLAGRVSDEDRLRWFRTADVLVSMSRHESFGLTLIEGLAAGVPVVASDIPAHREIADAQPHGAVRFVAPTGSASEVAEAVSAAASAPLPPGVRVTSWEDVVHELLKVYELVLADDAVRSLNTSR